MEWILDAGVFFDCRGARGLGGTGELTLPCSDAPLLRYSYCFGKGFHRVGFTDSRITLN